MSAYILVPTGNVNWFQTTVGKGDSSYRMDEEQPQAGFNSDTSSDLVAGPNLNDGLWHHWAGVWDGTNQYLYIDGALAGTDTPSAHNDQSTEFLAIGAAPDDTGRNFVGQICEVAIFPAALSAGQIAAIYNAIGFPAVITLEPASPIYDAGAFATLGPVTAIGSAPLSYQWYRGEPGSGTPLSNGNRISGANSGALVFNPVAGGDQGDYYMVVTNISGAATSSVVALTVNTTVNAHIFAGQSPTFSVTPGDGTTQYQWSTNGTPVAGATNHAFTLTNPPNNENVVCAITDSTFTGAVNGSVEKLTVVPAPTDPYAVAVLHDTPMAYFRLDEYNLYGDDGNGDDGTNAYDYINGHNGVYSNVVLNATGFPYAPPLPANTDGDASFGAAATDNSFAGFIPIDFGLAPSNSPAQPGNAEFSVEAWVKVEVGGNHGLVTKGYGGGNQAVPNGEQFSLQTSAGGGNFAFVLDDAFTNKIFIYTGNDTQWHHLVGVCDQAHGQVLLYKDGLLATSTTITPGNGLLSSLVPLSIGAKQTADSSGNYNGQAVGDVDEVAIYNYALSSNQVAAHYLTAGIAPVIVTAPILNITANAGATTNFTLAAFGTLPLSYQWSGPGGVIANATNATLTLVDVNFTGLPPNTGQGLYTCVITNLYGSNSVSSSLNVTGGAPGIIQDLPGETFAVVGGTTVFTVGVQGSLPLTNSWQFNGLTLADGDRVSGATNTTLTISNVMASDAGNYQFFVTNGSGDTRSSVSTLIIENEPLFNTNGEGWTGNGNSTYVASVTDNVLAITTAANGESTSFFFNTPAYIGAFQAKFTYQESYTDAAAADGMAFCVQNDPRGVTAVGNGATDVGYSGAAGTGIAPSAALAMELFPQLGSVGWNYLTNGEAATFFIPPTPVSLSSGDAIDWTITYNGSSITLGMFDEKTSGAYTTTTNVGSLPSILGADTAYIGFTGGTGGYNALQNVSNFSFTPLPSLSASYSDKNAVITWPTAIGGYVLQQSPSLSSAHWTTVPGPYNIVDGQYQVVVPSPAGNQFYRLALN